MAIKEDLKKNWQSFGREQDTPSKIFRVIFVLVISAVLLILLGLLLNNWYETFKDHF